jgi:hypothetical protein
VDTMKIIRYANEGFQNHVQNHIHRIKHSPIIGCYAFVEHEFPELLQFLDPFLTEKNRDKDNRHEAFISKDTMVFVRNMKLPSKRKHIYISNDKQDVFIPLEPIVKEIELNPYMSIPLPLDAYIEAPVGFVKKQLNELLSIYRWLEEDCGVSKETASINTRIIDFAEIIINADKIQN